MATHGDYVRAGFRHARGNDAYAGAGNKFHSYTRLRDYGTQIVDKLRQIFDAVDIVMRRRRNQRRARRGVTNPRDILGNLARGKLATFAGFGTLAPF